MVQTLDRKSIETKTDPPFIRTMIEAGYLIDARKKDTYPTDIKTSRKNYPKE